ncbi:MAG: hypothetical protein PF638_06305 [Candidatus Delongbacteria bacterium]|jgi:hypothetical protein|nr:hypothetical protein [Candidatus Delongbacteria bacterium]
MKNEIVIYKSGEIELNVSLKNETIWLRQDEIAKLYEKDRSVITRHINNILKDKEVNKESNVQKMHFANSDKPVKLYRQEYFELLCPVTEKCKSKGCHKNNNRKSEI